MARAFQVDDLLLYVREDRTAQDLAIASEVIVHDCYRLRDLHALSRRVDTIVDVGGHIGCFGLLAKSLWPEATLVALEPNEESADLYRQNLDANGIEDAEVISAALTYRSERHVLVGDGRSTGGCILVDEAEAERLRTVDVPTEEERYRIVASAVPTITLETLAERFELSNIDLLKLDCEGGENELCDRVALSFAINVELIVGEFHTTGGFERFARTARRAFPHLYFFGASDTSPIGPFWGLPTLGYSAMFFGLQRARRVARTLGFRRRIDGRRIERLDPDTSVIRPEEPFREWARAA